MRILSQDGIIDVPYEQVIVNIDYRNKCRIIASGVDSMESLPLHMAIYSTEQKAIKAMDMLHDIYESYTMYRIMNDKQRVFVENNFSGNKLSAIHGVFQFPKDEDVED